MLTQMNWPKFLTALLLAGAYQCRTAPRRCLDGAVAALRALFGRQERVGIRLKQVRLAHCQECCPVYYAPLGTCGSPRAANPEAGCHCYMPLKAGTRCNCWLYDNGHGTTAYGWDTDLNSFPYPNQDGTS